jgi:hypothetical protein
MKTFFKSVAAAAFLSLAAPIFAQDYIIIDRRVDEFDRWQDRLDYSYGTPVIARDFDVPVTVLEQQRTRTSLGYGGLMIANALARETGRPFEEIVAMRQSGMGWGRIAQDNGLKLGPIVSRFDRADTAFRSHGNVKRDQMKAAKFVNGHDARDGRLDKVKPAKFRGGGSQRVVKMRGNSGKAFAGKGNKGGGGGRGKK